MSMRDETLEFSSDFATLLNSLACSGKMH